MSRFYLIIRNFGLIALVSTFILSCETETCESDAYSHINLDIKVDRLEEQLREMASLDDAIRFIKRNQTAADYFFVANQYPNDTILARRLFRLFQEPSIDSLIIESTQYFENFQFVEDELESAFRFVKHQYPDAKTPRLQTVVTGFYNDMYVSDSLIVVGLDYFMGTRGKYYPQDIPVYIVKRYSKESVAPYVMSFISNLYNKIDRQHTSLLADMINIGKSYYFVSQSLPCKADSLIIGYTAEEMALVRANQETIWANLIQNELLYETDHFLKNKFVGESPNVVEISEKCPGRIGAWVGWEIVKKYMDKNPDVTLTALMQEDDAHKIFQKSGYKPKNVY